MACGGFTCTRSMLAMLNVFYIAVAFIMIGVAAYAKAVAVIATVSVMGGIIACGVFLLLVAVIGLIGAVKHHQVLLFFYMIILFLLFIVQFAVACACLALSDLQQKDLYVSGWARASYDLKETTQRIVVCCGCDSSSQNSIVQRSDNDANGHPTCEHLDCCKQQALTNTTSPCCARANVTSEIANNNATVSPVVYCPCDSCWTKIEHQLHQAVKFVGGLGLFFSFTELLAVWLTVRYRNTKDPKINPATFL